MQLRKQKAYAMSRLLQKKTSRLTFLLDENVDIRIATFLKRRRFEVVISPKGIKNGAVVKLAQTKFAILITNDNDFANTDLFKPSHYPGIIVFRIHPPALNKLKTALEKLFSKVSLDQFPGKLFTVQETGVEVTENTTKSQS
jgi:predicted nuclease of predicted toxin-antitoxin system